MILLLHGLYTDGLSADRNWRKRVGSYSECEDVSNTRANCSSGGCWRQLTNRVKIAPIYCMDLPFPFFPFREPFGEGLENGCLLFCRKSKS
eukprot:scaffold3703_cov149-Cylindrotheca_fusiformis.AAC.1